MPGMNYLPNQYLVGNCLQLFFRAVTTINVEPHDKLSTATTWILTVDLVYALEQSATVHIKPKTPYRLDNVLIQVSNWVVQLGVRSRSVMNLFV